MGRPKSLGTKLKEATEAGDSLSLLKIQREMCLRDLQNSQDDKCRVAYHNTLLRLNSAIIKIEGANAGADELAALLSADDELREDD